MMSRRWAPIICVWQETRSRSTGTCLSPAPLQTAPRSARSGVATASPGWASRPALPLARTGTSASSARPIPPVGRAKPLDQLQLRVLGRRAGVLAQQRAKTTGGARCVVVAVVVELDVDLAGLLGQALHAPGYLLEL